MGWNDRLGLLTDEDYEDYVDSVLGKADELRKAEKAGGGPGGSPVFPDDNDPED